MATIFQYPTSLELEQIAQIKMPRLTQNRPAFDLLPFRSVDEHLLQWEQYDNYTGLQSVRGLDGQPTSVKPIALKQFQMQPGTYGEFMAVTELEMTTRRAAGTFGTPINLQDVVLEKQDKLLQRRLDRIEYIDWQLLAFGTFAVANGAGQILHTDAFPLLTFASTVAWSTQATSTPLADFRTVQLLSRGQSVNFGNVAKAYMTQLTFNQMLANTNASDLYGRRTAGLGTFNNLQGVNELLFGDNLPQIVVYDQTWLDDTGAFHTFIPDGTVIVVGDRPAGQPVGEYRFTRNANNPDLTPGPYMRVIDRGEIQVPRLIEVHDGHNGGPVVYFPGAIVTMTVQ